MVSPPQQPLDTPHVSTSSQNGREDQEPCGPAAEGPEQALGQFGDSEQHGCVLQGMQRVPRLGNDQRRRRVSHSTAPATTVHGPATPSRWPRGVLLFDIDYRRSTPSGPAQHMPCRRRRPALRPPGQAVAAFISSRTRHQATLLHSPPVITSRAPFNDARRARTVPAHGTDHPQGRARTAAQLMNCSAVVRSEGGASSRCAAVTVFSAAQPSRGPALHARPAPDFHPAPCHGTGPYPGPVIAWGNGSLWNALLDRYGGRQARVEVGCSLRELRGLVRRHGASSGSGGRARRSPTWGPCWCAARGEDPLKGTRTSR